MKTEKRGKTPEDVFYDDLKGKAVMARLKVADHQGPGLVTGTLRWVDQYSIGVEVARRSRGGEKTVQLIMKGALATLMRSAA